jgi:hypothetical protein
MDSRIIASSQFPTALVSQRPKVVVYTDFSWFAPVVFVIHFQVN